MQPICTKLATRTTLWEKKERKISRRKMWGHQQNNWRWHPPWPSPPAPRLLEIHVVSRDACSLLLASRNNAEPAIVSACQSTLFAESPRSAVSHLPTLTRSPVFPLAQLRVLCTQPKPCTLVLLLLSPMSLHRQASTQVGMIAHWHSGLA